MKRLCEICGRGFTTVPSKVKKGRGRFCSCSCSSKWNNLNLRTYARREEYRKCRVCGSIFRCHPNRTKEACSRTCGGLLRSRRRRSWVWCSYCSELVSVPLNKAGRNVFCGPQCYIAWKEKTSCHEKNPNWRGGSTPEGHRRTSTQAWRRLRGLVLAEWGRRCARCERADRKLVVHHCIPYRICREDNIRNLMPLCVSCHSYVDNKREVTFRGRDFLYVKRLPGSKSEG